MRGVNAELGPWIRMTAPPEAVDTPLEDAPVGEPIFSSWILLGGILPIDRHHLMLTSVARERGFVEDSTSWSQRRWEHTRELKPSGDRACVVIDRLAFTPRVAASGFLLERIIGALFRRRHRVLRAHFGGREISP